MSEVPSHDVLRRWPHLLRLMTEIPDRDVNIAIGLLIGVNCPKALQPCEFISAAEEGPFAVRTALGWVISGPIQPEGSGCADGALPCFMTRSSEKTTMVVETGLSDMMLQSYEHDFNEPASGETCRGWPRCERLNIYGQSKEDNMFVTIIDNECGLVDGHHQLPLPFRNAGVVIPNNRTNASHRIAELKKRFSRDSVLQRECDIVCMSDGCANFVATADDNERQYGKSVGDALRTNFHVDDLLRSVGMGVSHVQAASVKHNITCAAGGFRLTEFISNTRQVIKIIPISDRARNVPNVDLSQTTLPMKASIGAWRTVHSVLGSLQRTSRSHEEVSCRLSV